MTSTTLHKQKGFTIIEVVLVLAIAGLIFLIVFLALPQLQKSRRDTQRKNDVGRVLSSFENSASNNGGTYPFGQTGAGSVDEFKTAYFATNFNDPKTGSAYTLTWRTASGAPSTIGEIYYAQNATCGANGSITTGSGNARLVAVSITLEAGGAYCQGNQ